LLRLFGNIELLYFTIHLLTWFTITYILYRLGRLLFERPAAAALGVVATLPPTPILGGGVQHTSMDHTVVCFALCLGAIFLFLRDRRLLAFAATGLIFNFNALVAGYTICLLGAAAVGDALFSKGRTWLRGVFLPLALFLLCASPILYWILQTEQGGQLTPEWLEVMRARSSHHSFPLSWGLLPFIQFTLFLALGVLGLRHPPPSPLHRRILFFAAGTLLLCGIGIVGAEIYPVRTVLRAQLFRSTQFIGLFALLYGANYMTVSWSRSILHKIACLPALLAVVFTSAYLPLLALALLGFGAAEIWVSARQRTRPPWGVLVIVIGIAVLRIALPRSEFLENVHLAPLLDAMEKLVTDPLLWTLTAAGAVVVLRSRVAIPRLRVALAGAVLLGLVLHVLPASYHRLERPTGIMTHWIDVQKWARENTPIDALFLTPPYRPGFRVYSERSVVAEWKDGTQQYFDADFARDWWERAQMLGENTQSFDRMDQQHYEEIARRYGATHLVTTAHRRLTLEKLYANRAYAVYRF